MKSDFKSDKNYWHCKKSFSWFAVIYEQLEKYEWYYINDKWEFNKALDLIQIAEG